MSASKTTRPPGFDRTKDLQFVRTCIRNWSTTN